MGCAVGVAWSDARSQLTSIALLPAVATSCGVQVGTSGASYSQVDIDKLRGYIQKLCQSTNPLGKCMVRLGRAPPPSVAPAHPQDTDWQLHVPGASAFVGACRTTCWRTSRR